MPINWNRLRRDITADDIAQAVEYVTNLPMAADTNDPNEVDTIWPVAGAVPTLKDAKFGLAQPMTVNIADLTASSKHLKRDKLLWHVQNPGQRNYVNAFTVDEQGEPRVLVADADGLTIIADGHHFLASGVILGFTTASAMCLPTNVKY
jgi:hypothetical protein